MLAALKLKNMFLIAITTFSLVSCKETRNDVYVSDFASFISETEDNYKIFGQDDWNKADKRFKLYSNVKYKKYRNSLSEVQSAEVNKLIGKYQALKVKASVRSAAKAVGDIIEQVSSAVDEIVKDTTIIE